MDDEAAAVLAENRRLRSDNRRLREEVEAYRRSRWWRLHPRRLARRLRQGDPTPAPAEPHPAPELFERARSATEDAFRREVVPKLEISRDSFSGRIAELDPLVAAVRSPTPRILEIGSYEGLSACYFLWRLTDAEVTCVDTFVGGLDDLAASRHGGLEATFDRNVMHLDASRMTKVVDDSRAALLRLQREQSTFDLVYVDGSHLGLDVLVDAALSWRLLADGGILVFDDYRWDDAGEDALLRPGPAIDATLALLAGKYELLLMSSQVAIRKVDRQA